MRERKTTHHAESKEETTTHKRNRNKYILPFVKEFGAYGKESPTQKLVPMGQHTDTGNKQSRSSKRSMYDVILLLTSP